MVPEGTSRLPSVTWILRKKAEEGSGATGNRRSLIPTGQRYYQRLIILQKKTGGIRPICAGTVTQRKSSWVHTDTARPKRPKTPIGTSLPKKAILLHLIYMSLLISYTKRS